MNSNPLFIPRRAAGWLLGLALIFTGLSASAQQDPPGVVARLNYSQGTVSFSPAGDDSWYDAAINRPITTGDRLWTDRGSRAEVSVGSAMLRMDDQTSVTVSELDDDTARITALQGSLHLRVRDDMAGQRLEIDTANLAVVIDAPGDYRIDADPASGTTRVAIAAGNATLYGEGGESLQLGGRQQLTVSGRALAAVSGAPVRANGAFEQWVAERSRLEDQSVSARYVSREVVGYQQLDNYGDWRNEADYGAVWYPRNVDADWAPYRDGQWVDVAPWGWTWVDAAPWGFAPSHYGRWARIGPRWGWVPGQRQARPVYSPAVVGFVGGGGPNANLAIGGGRNGVGWFPLAPGEAWRPGYRASQRYIDEANRAAAYNRQAARSGTFANQTAPGAITIVPIDVFGRGPIGRRDAVRLPDERWAARAAVGAAPSIPLRGDRPFAGIGRPAPQPVFQAQPQQAFQAQQLQQQRELLRQQQQPLQGAQAFERPQDALRQQQQLQFQQRAAQAQAQGQAQQFQQAQQMQQLQQQQQREAARQQQEAMQRGAQAQAQQQQMQMQLQQQQALRQQQEMQQRAAQAQMQNQQLQLQQQQMQMQQQQALRAQQQQQQQMQAQQQQGAMRQAQELQQRALQMQQQQRQQQMQRSGLAPQQQQP